MPKSCPSCKSDLNEMKVEGVDLDFCSGCKGVWMDKEEFAFYAELAVDIPHLDEIKESAAKTEKVCPNCAKNLKELTFARDPDLLIDRCDDCGGLWFDKAELRKAEDAASKLTDPKSRMNLALRQIKEKGYEVL